MTNERLTLERLKAVQSDRVSGASELARRALEGVATFVEQCEADDVEQLRHSSRKLAVAMEGARPSMVSIAGLVGRWRRTAEGAVYGSVAEARRGLAESARELVAESVSAVERVAGEVASLVPPGCRLITISRSSTALAALRKLRSKSVRVVVCESRPLMEGVTLARELSADGIPVELITDAQLGHFTAETDLALVGADALLADGTVVNKAGTSLLALAAAGADVPFWVCFESFKRSSLDPEDFPLEEAGGWRQDDEGLGGVQVRNVVFDMTPAFLVTRWIDESGSRFVGC